MSNEQYEVDTQDMWHSPREGEIPSLNGWRAVSVGMVLIAHSNAVPDPSSIRFYLGTLGVKFFFVISGFLITTLLLREFGETGGVSLKAFYLRRAFRILPVYYVYLLVCFVIRDLCPAGLSVSQLSAALAFLTNYTEAKGITGHLWTLGVEEQFYLIWPLVFVWCHGREKRLIIVLVCVVLFCPLARGVRYLIGSDPSSLLFNRFSFLIQADVLALGCLAAVLAWYRSWLLGMVSRNLISCAALGTGILFGARLISGISGANLIKVPLGPTLEGIGFILLMVPSIICPSWIPFRALNMKPIAWLGVLSYSIYIWHVLFAPSAWPAREAGGAIWRGFPGWVVLAIAVAAFSYYLLERPFVALRKRFTTHR